MLLQTRLSGVAAGFLCAALSQNVTLEHLDLSGNALADERDLKGRMLTKGSIHLSTTVFALLLIQIELTALTVLDVPP